MSDLPGPLLFYNSVFFRVENVVEFNSTPVPDAANRAVIATRIDLTVKAYVCASNANLIGGLPSTADDTEAWGAEVRKLLQQPGGTLTFQGLGIGDIVINDPSPPTGSKSVKDLRYGPWPKLLSLRPLGGQFAFAIVWRVEAIVNDVCPNNPGKGVMEFNYRLSWDVDKSGYQRRVYSGHLAIAGTRKSVNDTSLSDQADAYREKVFPALLPGFRRIPGRFDISHDKLRLEFSCVDEQLPPNQLPEGVVEASASHRVELGLAHSLRWINTISAEYELAYDRPRSEAWGHFVKLFESRMAETNKVLGPKKIIPIHLSLSEPEIYGRKSAAFSLSYSFVVGLGELLRAVSATGLWQPTPENDWSKWSASMVKSKVMVARGNAGLGFDLQADAIVSICKGGGSGKLTTANGAGNTLTTKPPAPKSNIPAVIDQLTSLFKTLGGSKIRVNSAGDEIPDEEDSWVDYQLWIHVEPHDSTVGLVPLPTQPVPYRPQKTRANDTTGYTLPYGGTPDLITQYRAGPALYVTLSGTAVRAGHPITPPQLVSLGGVTPLPANREGNGYRTGLIRNTCGVPLNAAAWSFRYLIPRLPTAPFVAPPNPLSGEADESPSSNDGLSGFLTSG